MDVVALAGIGVKNAVASLGTALTKEQAKLLKKFVNTVYLCYDGDDAGQNASDRAIPILQAEGLTVLVIEMPDGMDPDDFAKAYGPEGFAKAKSAALSAMAVSYTHLMSREVEEATAQLRDYMFKEVYLDSAAKIEEKKVQEVINLLFEYYLEHLEELPLSLIHI